MNKLTIIGLGNEGRRNYFVSAKSPSFFPLIIKFLSNMGLDKTGIMYGYEDDKTNINTVIDVIENISNNKYDVDIIYQKKKVTLIIRTDEENKSELLKEIKKIADYKGFE